MRGGGRETLPYHMFLPSPLTDAKPPVYLSRLGRGLLFPKKAGIRNAFGNQFLKVKMKFDLISDSLAKNCERSPFPMPRKQSRPEGNFLEAEVAHF